MHKRILHIITELDVGGTEKQLLLLLPELQKKFDNEVICLTGHGPIGPQIEETGITVHYVGATAWWDPRLSLRLWRLLYRRRPSAIITYLILADMTGRLLGRLAGVQTIICSQRSRLFGPAWWHQLDRFTRFLVTHYTCQTQTTKELLQQTLKLRPEQVTVIPNAVAETLTQQTEHKRSHNQNSTQSIITITCVANLKPEKRIDLLLEVFEQLATRHPHIQLQLVGEGPERKKLEHQISHYTTKKHIYFLGLRSDIPKLLATSDIFVLPTSIEGMSNALLEAMAAGLPCLTTNLPVNAEIISEGQNGLLFDLSNPLSLLNQLERLIADPNLRQNLGGAAKAHIHSHHSLPHIGKQWVALINEKTYS